MTDTLVIPGSYSSQNEYQVYTNNPTASGRSAALVIFRTFEVSAESDNNTAPQLVPNRIGRSTVIINNTGGADVLLGTDNTSIFTGSAIKCAAGGSWSLDTEAALYFYAFAATELQVVELYTPLLFVSEGTRPGTLRNISQDLP
jgi:hypothetical protein